MPSLFVTLSASAATHYVDASSTSPLAPYSDWTTAATNIQDAVDIAQAGDLVLVTNGIYQSGGRVVYGQLTNRLVINKPITVQSLNGPAVTLIEGYQVPNAINGDSAVRCVYMTNRATLIGFTVTNGATRDLFSGDAVLERSGGGIWCEGRDAFISNCVISGNSCFMFGAGVYSGTVLGSQVLNNTNHNTSEGGGGGAAYSTLLNSTLSSNHIDFTSAGAFACSLSNCVANGNAMGGVTYCSMTNCLIENSTNYSSGGGAALSLAVACQFSGNSSGVNGGGVYDCSLLNCTLSNNLAVRGGGACYDESQTNPPGENNQVIGNSALDGGGVWLGFGAFNTNWALSNWHFNSNSVAQNGGGLFVNSTQSSLSNCSFVGNSSGGGGGGLYAQQNTPVLASNCMFNGNAAVGTGGGAFGAILDRCLVETNEGGSGGGVYGGIHQCVIEGNIAHTNGGGVLIMGYAHCDTSTIENNLADTGGGINSMSYYAVSNCIILDNKATTSGGGALADLVNCLVVGNSAQYGGGVGIKGSSVNLKNCTIVGNSAINAGGGAYSFTAANSIIYDNTAPSGSNVFDPFNLVACCTIPLPLGAAPGNITNPPEFVDAAGGNYRLQTNSPCINVGNNSYASTNGVDLDGRPRVVAGTVDIGAYEFQGPSMGEFTGWLQQYGLPTDGSADYADTDGDGMNNWNEWICGTDPTNALSVLRMLSVSNGPSGATVTWETVNTRDYFVQRSEILGLATGFVTVATNIAGQVGVTTYADTNTQAVGPFFYRVGVHR